MTIYLSDGPFTLAGGQAVDLPPITRREGIGSAKLFTSVICLDSERSEKLTVTLHCGKGPDGNARKFVYTIRMMPRLRVNLLFRLKYLDGELHFPPMEPGTLKSGITGRSLKPDDIGSVSLSLSAFQPGAKLTFENLRLTDEEPAPIPADRVLCDELGQWNEREWVGKTKSADELAAVLNAELADVSAGRLAPERPYRADPYGGNADLPLTVPSDRFTTVKKDGKWWLADPAGNAFYSTGVFGVYPGEFGWVHGNEDWLALPPHDGSFAEAWEPAEDEELYRRKFHGLFDADTELCSFGTANLIRALGRDWREKWTKLTRARLDRMSVTTLSMFSDKQFIKDTGIPFVVMLERYPTTGLKLFREFPDVYDEAFERAAEVYASQLSAYAENPCFIGYFMNNEPTFMWAPEYTLAETTLEKDMTCASKRRLIVYLSERYGGISALNEAWRTEFPSFEALQAPVAGAHLFSERAAADLTAFSAELLRRWAGLPASLCRKAAPKRLNLGMRYASVTPLTLETLEYFDVYTFNCYGTDPGARIDRVTAALRAAKLDMPVMITEFHFGAYDAGLPAASLVPFETQEERCAAFRAYTEEVARHPNAVGAHWFAWNDQPLFGRYDCENFQFGYVDICNRVYPLFGKTAADVNGRVFELHRNG